MPLFDPAARALARARARRLAGDQFLYARAIEELVERLGQLNRPAGRLLLVGALDPAFARILSGLGWTVDTLDGGGEDDQASFDPATYDAGLVLGGLDTVEDVPGLLQALKALLRPDAPLVGAFLGGDSLPQLRRALIEADRETGTAKLRAHPRIGASAFAGLLQDAGFAHPVVDVDRVEVRYSSLDRLVGDLRAMAATNILNERPRVAAGKAWKRRLEDVFLAGQNANSPEAFDLIHFLAWVPAPR